MVIPQSTFVTPNKTYRHIIDSFRFTDKMAPGQSIVKPYCLVTDGRDLLIFQHPESGALDFGFSFRVERPSGSRKNTEDNFLAIVEKQAKQNFLDMFSKAKSVFRMHDPVLKREVSIEEDIDDEIISVGTTSSAVYNLDKSDVCPTFVLRVTSPDMLKLIPKEGYPNMIMIDKTELLWHKAENYVTQTIMNFVKDNTIILNI